MSLFIGNLPEMVDEDAISKAFKKFGTCKVEFRVSINFRGIMPLQSLKVLTLLKKPKMKCISQNLMGSA
jgi:RNA recognition motif-containing protein